MTDDPETKRLLFHIKDWLGWIAFWLFLIFCSSCACCANLDQIKQHLSK